ncbi:MAG: hypothetical protein K6L74_16040 [Neptuniibacter sp.]
MNDVEELLKAADDFTPSKTDLTLYKDVIINLRRKGASWREISQFFADNADVEVDHTKIARTAASWGIETDLTSRLPLCEEIIAALRSLSLSNNEKTMLLHHYQAPHRTVTYTELAHSVGKNSYQSANKIYGTLASKLCDELEFSPLPDSSGRPFYGNVIGWTVASTGAKEESRLVMHHEFSKAIEKLLGSNQL